MTPRSWHDEARRILASREQTGMLTIPADHDCGNPNCRGLDYGPSECGRCGAPIHGGPDYCVECRSEIEAAHD